MIIKKDPERSIGQYFELNIVKINPVANIELDKIIEIVPPKISSV